MSKIYVELTFDPSMYLEGFKAGLIAAAEIMAPESEIESELNKNGITTEDGEE